MKDIVGPRVHRATELIGSEEEDEHKELGFLIHELADIVQRAPGTPIYSDAVKYKIDRLLESRFQSTSNRHSPDVTAGQSVIR